MSNFLVDEFDILNDDNSSEICTKPNISIDNYMYFSYEDLKNIKNEELRNIALKNYFEVFNSIQNVLSIKPGASISHMLEKTNDYSHMFPNNHPANGNCINYEELSYNIGIFRTMTLQKKRNTTLK